MSTSDFTTCKADVTCQFHCAVLSVLRMHWCQLRLHSQKDVGPHILQLPQDIGLLGPEGALACAALEVPYRLHATALER